MKQAPDTFRFVEGKRLFLVTDLEMVRHNETFPSLTKPSNGSPSTPPFILPLICPCVHAATHSMNTPRAPSLCLTLGKPHWARGAALTELLFYVGEKDLTTSRTHQYRFSFNRCQEGKGRGIGGSLARATFLPKVSTCWVSGSDVSPRC